MTAADPTGPRDVLLAKVMTYVSRHGVGDTSLRGLADGAGTSHRMLIYHFGSREGLLTALIDLMRHQQLAGINAHLRAPVDADPAEVLWSTWQRLATDAPVFAPLLFELSAAAMVGQAWALPLREMLQQGSLVLRQYFEQLGQSPQRAELVANTAMAVIRGTVFDLVLTGDRKAADDVVRGFLGWALGHNEACASSS